MVSQNLNPIVIAGPTASGKSAYGLKLALELGGEIICADSRQIYKYMSIGTACPSAEEYAAVKHHGFERLEPNEIYSAGQFIHDTDAYVQEIQSRGKVPILVGGTGLYLRAWRFGLDDVTPSNSALRTILDTQETSSLYEQLRGVDPESAAKISPSDAIRIKRALEIHSHTGQPASVLRVTNWSRAPRVEARWLLLTPPPPAVIPGEDPGSRIRPGNWIPAQGRDDRTGSDYDLRLKTRVAKMFEQALIQEALKLREYPGSEHLLITPGYQEALQHADGLLSLEEAIEKTFRRHRQYAKRQMTWFKKEPWWQPIAKSP